MAEKGIKRYFTAAGKADAPPAKRASVGERTKLSSTQDSAVKVNPKIEIDLTKDDAPTKTGKRDVVDLSVSDEDDDMPVAVKRSPRPSTRVASRAKAEPKASAAPAAPSRRSAQPSSQPSSGPSGDLDAKSILSKIPDAELPEVDPTQKVNFRQIMEARQSHAEPAQGQSAEPLVARPNCLAGLTFVVTGQLPTLGRDEIQGLIKQYGGNVTGSISGKTSCLVLGSDAGPSKITKAKKLGLKVIDEDGFRTLLRELPADGGSGEDAQKAMLKRKQLEAETRAEASRIREEQRIRAEKARAAASSTDNAPPANSELWTTKFAPRNLSEICGNNSSVNKLRNWLQNWSKARSRDFQKTPGVEGSEFRAAMLHGPPGIGKTTAASLVAKLLGYDVIEYNASDTRSKSLLQQHVSQTLGNKSVFSASDGKKKKICVIMDEVDGMSAGDRGGVGAMAAMARKSDVPLILICNERTLPKMRPFDRVVFDIPFRRPDTSAIHKRIMAIAAAQGLVVDTAAVASLVEVTRSDIRQILNLLSMYAMTADNMGQEQTRSFTKSFKKEVILKPFDIAGRYLSRAQMAGMTFNESIELYFNDYDFAPLMVQENYINSAPSLKSAAEAANSISEGDLVDRQIHGPQQQWSLMPLHAVLSCVIPAFNAAGHSRERLMFSSYLGNNSKATKYRRLLAEVRSHLRLKLSASAKDLRLDYHGVMVNLLLQPLLKKQQDGIEDVLEFMDNYYLTREDWDVVMELGVGPNSSEIKAKAVPTAVKSAFTRKYNASSHPLPFMKAVDVKNAASQVKRGPAPDLEDVIEDDVAAPDAPEEPAELTLEEQIANDKYIKRPAAKRGKKASTAGAAKKPATRAKAATKSRSK